MTKERAIKLRELIELAAKSLDDETALDGVELYPRWLAGVDYSAGDRIAYNDMLYRVEQSHTSQAGWEPGNAPALFTIVQKGGGKDGDIDHPIPVTGIGMEFTYGFYYTWQDVLYKCERTGCKDGDKVVLYFTPDQLVGQYFTVVERGDA